MTRGKFIVLEGIDTSGKSTQIQFLYEELNRRGVTTLKTRAPGGTPGGLDIRHLLVNGEANRWGPTTELLLFLADRCHHIETMIEPALARGDWVVSDRYSDSTLAYQCYGRGRSCDLANRLTELTASLVPDLTILLDIPMHEYTSRLAVQHSNERRFESMGNDFMQRVHDGYLDIANNNPHNHDIINAIGHLADVHIAIMETIERRFHI